MKKILLFLTIPILLFGFIILSKPQNVHNFHKKSNAETSSNLTENKVPMLAIVIDDFGSYDQSGVNLLLQAKPIITGAVIPSTEYTEKNIKDLEDVGCEIILHMPMQSHVNLPENWYGEVYIRNTDTPETARMKLSSCLKDFPKIYGFNIHIGSGVSQNEKLMEAIYNYAKENNLYFLDSRTIETKSTELACSKTNSIYLGRDVFLEADKNKSYSGVVFRLKEAANIALTKGYAIAIGHVGAEGGENTAKAIIDTLPEIEKMGVKIVYLKDIFDMLNS